MKSQAVVFNSPKQLSLQALDLPELQTGQIEVAVEFSGISTGTERMLWQPDRMKRTRIPKSGRR